MTLDDMELSIYQGEKGIKNALTLIETYIDKKKLSDDKVFNITKLTKQIKLKLAETPVHFFNQLVVTERYRNYIKEVIEAYKSSGNDKIENTTEASKKVLGVAESDSNKRILAAKEPETKRNREIEKNEIFKVFKRISFLTNLFDIYNLLYDVKTEING
jgi:hypothetical protein